MRLADINRSAPTLSICNQIWMRIVNDPSNIPVIYEELKKEMQKETSAILF